MSFVCGCNKKGNPSRMDDCMTELVWCLNACGVRTFGSCCGHGVYPATVIVKTHNGNTRELFSGILIHRKARFYRKDAKGRYFIPEVTEEKK
jgi:hypothetical protein